MTNERLTIVMPVYNEATVAGAVLDEWRSALDAAGVEREWIIVDDGSTDGTAGVLDRYAVVAPEVRVFHQRNAGHGAACRRGYGEAARGDAKWVLQIDSDGQCDPAYFKAFWSLRESFDCIFGCRTTRGDGFARRVVSAVCGMTVSAIAGLPRGDFNVPYRLLRRETLAEALESVDPSFELQNVALAVALRRAPGVRWTTIPIHFRARTGGTNSLNFRGIVRLALRMLRQRRTLQR